MDALPEVHCSRPASETLLTQDTAEILFCSAAVHSTGQGSQGNTCHDLAIGLYTAQTGAGAYD